MYTRERISFIQGVCSLCKMKNVTLGLEGMEISELIRELRVEKSIRQEDLYGGLCGRKKYFQLENGEVVMDEFLSERLIARLHVQYKLIDIMLDDDNFRQKEWRYEINLQVRKRAWEQAENLLKKYEDGVPKTGLHTQYVLAKRAEILWKTGQDGCGKKFCEALELTMPVVELEHRLMKNGVIAEDELWMYFCYRICDKPFSVEEYLLFLKRVEELFLSVQIYAEVYFEAAYQCAFLLWQSEQYAQCREICQKAILWLKRGRKEFHLSEFYFLDAMAGMKLKQEPDEERNLFQQCKMAYYVASSFGEEEVAGKIRMQCREEFGWHITD